MSVTSEYTRVPKQFTLCRGVPCVKTVSMRRGHLLMAATFSGIARLSCDRRGAVALETPFVLIVLFFSLLFPLADLAVAGFALIGGFQTLRDFGQYLQYHVPPDLTNYSSWKAALPSTVN